MLVLVTVALLSACSSAPTPPPSLVFNIKPDIQANNGGLFYFVVRKANEKQFMQETYADVASKAFVDPVDPESLGIFSIVPGAKQVCEVSQPAQGSVALYFLLTQPSSQWKKLITMPFQESYDISLKPNSQVEIAEHKAWYSLF
ncbi:MAG: hypothetical protein D0531_07140 [Methylococcales bacterium]|nr:MAG: hypothetical protein D0531_07140 [Methylococcales bacterium]